MTTRRSFLTMLGLSPVVAAVPAVAAKDVTVSVEGVRALDQEINRLEWYDDGSFAINMGNSSIRTRCREGDGG